jgi:uncharacterized RDD family membrane protein YckC
MSHTILLRRAAGAAVDTLLLILVVGPASVIVGMLDFATGGDGQPLFAPFPAGLFFILSRLQSTTYERIEILLLFIAVVLLRPMLLAACESSTWQGTPGKRLFGLRCVSNRGEHRIGYGRALLRALASSCSLPIPWITGAWVGAYAITGINISFGDPALLTAFSLLPILYVWACFGSGRCIHDFVAGTKVISTRD